MQNLTNAAVDPIGWHGTTILCVRRDGKVTMAGDGQVSMGQTIVKGNARKVRRIGAGGTVICGFAGATAGETNVRVFGDTAVLMGVINAAGGPQSKQIRVVLVCQKRPEGWQMVAAQMTRVP